MHVGDLFCHHSGLLHRPHYRSRRGIFSISTGTQDASEGLDDKIQPEQHRQCRQDAVKGVGPSPN